jgi:uncharacterized repeat protein (TIGR04076 family)
MSEPYGTPVRIEVVEIMGTGRCAGDLHDVGDVWIVRDAVVPEGMCSWAYNAIEPFVSALRCGGRFPWSDETVARACCPDADNPVVFRVSAGE